MKLSLIKISLGCAFLAAPIPTAIVAYAAFILSVRDARHLALRSRLGLEC
jgi:hypothetical protein